MSSERAARRRTTIRLFPDYAPSVIWFTDGPVAYERTRLSDELVAALNEWDSFFYSSMNLETRGFTNDALRNAFLNEGRRLARSLAREVGAGFEIEYDSVVGKVTTISEDAAENPEAALFFNDLADAELAQARRWAENRERSGSVRLVRKADDGSLHEIVPSGDDDAPQGSAARDRTCD